MPLVYAAKPMKPSLASIDEAKDWPEAVAAIKKVLGDILQDTNEERARLASAVNGTGGIRGRYVEIADDYFVSSNDGTIAFDVSGGNVTATLPLVSEYPGMQIRGLEVASGSTATFTPRGSDTIDGAGSPYTVTTPVLLQADSLTNDWVVVG